MINETCKLNIAYDKSKNQNFIIKEYSNRFLYYIKNIHNIEDIEESNLKKCNSKYIIKLFDYNKQKKYSFLNISKQH